MNPAVSLIVPVYNAEPYLRRCVDSILNQDFRDFELLLVDDGSQDASGTICDIYASMDRRVFVIHKENSGVSDSRNRAIARARGTYLQFLDSDDWITPDATKLLVRAAMTHHCDMVIADFYRVVGERVSHKGDIEEDTVLSREEFAGHMMENPADFYYGVIWNKLYRRDLIEKHHLRMNTELNWCEDFMFNLEYILHAETFYALKAPIYYYVKRKGSLVSQNVTIGNAIRMKLRVFEYYNNFYKHVLDEKDYEKNGLQVYRFLLDSAKDGMVFPAILPGSQKLGAERTSVSSAVVDGDGVLMDAYRSRKLLDRYLEIVALKNDLSLDETRLLLYLNHSRQIRTRKELADFTGMSRRNLALALQKLAARGFLRIEERRPKANKSSKATPKSPNKRLYVSFLPSVKPILAELAGVLNDYDQIRFADFTEDELAEYTQLSKKIKENMKRALR